MTPPTHASITEPELLGRRIHISGTHNLRDIGGYPTLDGRTTRWGRVMRSDALHRVDKLGLIGLTDLKIRTLVDLRGAAERNAGPSPARAFGARIIPCTLFDPEGLERGIEQSPRSGASLSSLAAEVYWTIVRERGELLSQAVGSLAEPGALPAIVHCTAGKDRTGIVVALLLASLGVPEEVVVADYAATNLFLTDDFVAVLTTNLPMELDPVERQALLAADPMLMGEILVTIREEHGSVRDFLLHYGLRPEQLVTLEDELLHVPPAGAA
ncbi:MAG TPA: tyrosine-protein phosphatase [Acidimicrobiales bacterium]|nr:tyrosine-protein phosphatase [Acidimicrobiales bacterium]